MHYTHVVALPGDIPADELHDHLTEAMAPFDENLTVALHRDTSVYAEHRDVELRKARAYAERRGEPTDDEAALLRDWNGVEQWTDDGWPMTTGNPNGQWDYWRVGGRWAEGWVLKADAERGPLQAESNDWDAPPAPDHDRPTTDSARKQEIEPESINSTYSWLDLVGEWHTKWVGPTPEEATSDVLVPSDTTHWEVNQAQHDAAFFAFLAALPGDTWLVHIDYHN